MRLAIALCAAALPLFAAGAARACEVTEVTGRAVIASGDVSSELSPGMRAAPGQRIETGPASRVTLTCENGLTVAVAPDSRLQIDRLHLDAPAGRFGLFRRGGQMRLIEGAAGFLMRNLGGSRFRVRTPNAVAAVRSTEWAMETTRDASAVFVREGRVRVTGGGTSQRLGPGEGIDVTPGRVSGARNWGAPRVEALNARIGGAWP